MDLPEPEGPEMTIGRGFFCSVMVVLVVGVFESYGGGVVVVGYYVPVGAILVSVRIE